MKNVNLLTSLSLMMLILLAGCAPPKAAAPSVSLVEDICRADVSLQLKNLSSADTGSLLARAAAGGCWESAITAALENDVALPQAELIKGLKHFNRAQSSAIFDHLVEHYLTAMAGGQIAYGEKEQRLLEAYSRHAIRNARSQESPPLRLVQQICWRLDRPLYARLFE